MADQMLSALQSGKYQGRGREISEYLKKKLKSKDTTATKQQCLYAVKFLYIYTTDFDKLPETEIVEAIQAVEDCCSYIQGHSNNVKDFQTSEKLLYHVLSKTIKRAYLTESVRLAKCLSVFLNTGDRHGDANAQKIGQSSYTILWNAAIQEEKNTNADAQLCLSLRHQAVFHLLLSGRATERGKEIITWTIDHYSRVISKQNLDRPGYTTACACVEALVMDVCGVIKSRITEILSEEEENAYVEMFLKIHLHLLSFRLKHDGGGLCPSIVDRIASFIDARQTKPQIKDTLRRVYSVLLQVIQVGVYLAALTSNNNLDKDSDTKGSKLVSSLEKVNNELTLISKGVLDLNQVTLLHSVLRFSLQLPEDVNNYGGKIPKLKFHIMTENMEEVVLRFYGTAAKFYEAASKTMVTRTDKRLSAALHFSNVKLLQLKLQQIAARLETLKVLTESPVKEELAAVSLDLSRLDEAVTARSTYEGKSIPEDLHQLASLSYKFGRMCFFRGLHLEATGFLKSCIPHFQQWIKDPTVERPATLNMWKKYEMLADSHRRTGLANKALVTLAKGILAEPDNLSSALEMWVRIKADVAKTTPGKTDTRSLWSYIKNDKPSITAHRALNAELNTYKKYRTNHHELIYAIVEELLEATASCPADHACALLEKGTLLWATRKESEMTAQECCQKAATLLEGVLVDQKSAQLSVKNDLARAYLWCHLVADVDPLELRKDKKEPNSTEKKEAAFELEADDNEAYHDCCTLDMERQSTKMADLALELWEEVANGNSVEAFDKPTLTSTIDCITVLTDLYKLTHRMQEEFRTLVVLDRLCCPADHPQTHLRTQTDLIHFYSRLHQPHLALPLVDATTTWLQQEKPKTCLSTVQHILFLLASAEAILLSGQVNRGCETLYKAIEMKTENLKPKSPEALTLDASINRVAATILALPPSYHSDHHDNCSLQNDLENALELEVKGTRSISGVVCFLLGEWLLSRKGASDKVPCITLNKWALLDGLLTSLYSTGATCVQLGEAQEAKCYLQQGLKLAQGFHLPRRFAAFHLELSKLESLSAKFTDSQSHINVAFYTLNSTDQAPKTTDKNGRLTSKDSAPEKLSTSQSDNVDDEMVIKMRPIEMSEVLEESDVSSNEIGSPTARRWKPRCPTSWSHPVKCSCFQCQDVIGQGLQLKYLVQQAYCLFQQGLSAQAEASWILLLQNFDSVTNRARYTILKLVSQRKTSAKDKTCATGDTGKTSKKVSKSKQKEIKSANDENCLNPSMFQKMLVDVCQHFTELAISKQNWELYDQWVSKAQELLGTEKYPWMVPCYQNLAEILYLKIAPSLPLPKVDEKSDLQELCERIGRVTVDKLSLDEQLEDASKDEAQILTPSEVTGTAVDNSVTNKSECSDRNKNPKQKQATSQIPKIALHSSKRSSKRVSEGEVSNTSKGEDTSVSAKGAPLGVSYKTPARTKRPSRANISSVSSKTPSVNGLEKPYLRMFKTPKSVSGRQAMLDMLINSDSDEDILKSAKVSVKKKGPTASKTDISVKRTRQKKTESISDKSKTLMTPNVRFDVLSPSGGNTLKNSQKPKDGKLLFDVSQNRTPSRATVPATLLFKAGLNRSVRKEMGSENVFDFIPSSPEDASVAAVGKKRPGKPGRKAVPARARKSVKKAADEADIEVKRETEKEIVDDFITSGVHCETNDEESVSPGASAAVETDKPQPPVSVNKRTTGRKKNSVVFEDVPEIESMGRRPSARRQVKLTRSKTAVLETNRDVDSSEDSLSISLDSSAFFPEEESFSEEKSTWMLNPEADFYDDDGDEDDEPSVVSTSEARAELPSSFLVNPSSPVEMVRSATESSIPYQPAFETVQEEESIIFPEYTVSEAETVMMKSGLSPTWMQEPIEIPRGGEMEKENKTGTKGRRNAKKVQPKHKENPAKLENVTNSLSTLSVDDEPTTTKEQVDKVDGPQNFNASMNPVGDLSSHLDHAFSLLTHYPAPIPYRRVCHAKVLVELNESNPDPWALAFYLTESHSVSFRHSALGNISRKIRKLRDAAEPCGEGNSQLSRLQLMQKRLTFGGSVSDLRDTVNTIPEDWTVVQITMLTVVGESRGRLALTRFNVGEDPLVVQLPGFATTQGQKVLQDFSAILKTNSSSMVITDKAQWWARRHALNEKIEDVLEDMESRWFGPWIGLLQGRLDNEDDHAALEAATAKLALFIQIQTKASVCHSRIKLLLRTHHLVKDRELTKMVCELCSVSPDSEFISLLLTKISTEAKSLNLSVSTRFRPVLLILDKAVQHLPWESMPSVRGQPLSRVPSLHFLHAHLGALQADAGSVYNVGVDHQKTFYVLNPDDNLDYSQTVFEPKFKSEDGWKGVIGKPPTSAEFAEGVTEHDLFIYCGHGSGSKFLSGNALASLQCRAAVMLMGCSSGRLAVDGQLEASGLMLNYFLGGCPCIVSCLWDVTDRDIDRFLEELLTRWKKSDTDTSLLDCVHKSRDICRLPYLTGAAPVVYGLPVSKITS